MTLKSITTFVLTLSCFTFLNGPNVVSESPNGRNPAIVSGFANCASQDEAITLLHLSYQKGVKYSDILDIIGTGNSKYDSRVVQAVSGTMTLGRSSRNSSLDGEAIDWELAKSVSDVSRKNKTLSKLLISEQRGISRKLTISHREKVEVSRNYPDRVYRDLFVRLKMSPSHKVYLTIVFREMFGMTDDSIHRCICEHNIDGALNQLENWLWENGPFIVYVEESDSFVVDVAAKAAGRPIPFSF